MMRGYRVYSTFEDFEREELRPHHGLDLSVDDMLGELFSEELDIAASGRGRRDDDEDEDDDE
jgi:hypothetical protein